VVAGYSDLSPLVSILAVLLDYTVSSFRVFVFPVAVLYSYRLSLCLITL
jgi:hypothetical protein